MNIELLNTHRNELLSLLEEPEGYVIPKEYDLIETVDIKQDKDMYLERRRIHLDGVYINVYKRSQAHEREIWVRSDAPYLQMHFEISGGSAYYFHQNKKFAVPISEGEFSFFYVPELNGRLVDPPCKDAVTVEIEISEKWIRQHIGTSPSPAMDFVDDIASGRPALLGGRSHLISPQIFRAVQDLLECPYAGNIKRLYLEAKLMELLAHQLFQVQGTGKGRQQQRYSKADIEQLHFVREKIISDLTKHHSIDELSYLSHMNRTKLQAGFKELFGVTIHDFIVEQRMNLAYKLLTESYAHYWNISEIAGKVGYQRSNHFSAAFKKRFGLSPSSFLKK